MPNGTDIPAPSAAPRDKPTTDRLPADPLWPWPSPSTFPLSTLHGRCRLRRHAPLPIPPHPRYNAPPWLTPQGCPRGQLGSGTYLDNGIANTATGLLPSRRRCPRIHSHWSAKWRNGACYILYVVCRPTLDILHVGYSSRKRCYLPCAYSLRWLLRPRRASRAKKAKKAKKL